MEPDFKAFTDNQVIDATTSIQTILALSAADGRRWTSWPTRRRPAGGIAPKGTRTTASYTSSFTTPTGTWMDPDARTPA